MKTIISTLGAVVVLAGLSGCTHSAKGYLYTKDSTPLILARDDEVSRIKQGHTRLKFGFKPFIFNYLTLENPDTSFKVKVYRSDYSGNSFFVDSLDSELSYDIQGRWREERDVKFQRDERKSCTIAGHCAKEVSRMVCSKKAYREGTDGYEKHENDKDCEEERRTEYGDFPDCPGSRAVRNSYQGYKNIVTVSFIDPRQPSEEFAVFDGETGHKAYFLKTEFEGDCGIN